ncbi:iron uptake porin [[Leptolyngbya] sp. PCC 7376]|uniref:iron uptake porin n=1 Tax=[Leptolyngbya] sp. PCC 7376 TaxID=111781 RepID=UPI001CEDCFD8|nr:iron uptake porin [[Leptolyngbya] sp. PCC 7376]
MRTLLGGASVALGATVALSSAAIAEDSKVVLDQISQYNDTSSFAQVNSVFQLRDVAPSDWAFDALRNLVEKYNCIVGYPDGTFRGNRPLSRYEFAAGLNACMQQIERLIVGGDTPDAADITRLRALVQEFEAELATLGARVDDIEGRVEFLEDNQFSTTTKLKGEAIFTVANAFGENRAGGGDLDSQVTFNNRVRLNLDTSFREDGKDRLRTRLQAGNFGGSGTLRDDITGTDSTRLGHDASTGNSIEVDDLYYYFPLGQKGRGYVSAVGLGIHNIFDINNPYFSSSGTGALSRFARRNPATLRRSSGAGAGFNYKFSDKVKFSAAYIASDSQASNPSQARGLFNGEYSLGAQLAVSPSDSLDIAFTYVNGYDRGDSDDLSGSTTDGRATNLFGGSPISSNNFGISSSWAVSEKFNLSGWVGYTDASNESADEDADIWTWAAQLALKDVGGTGNVLGLMFGQPPKVTSNDNMIGDDSDTSYIAELQYRYKLNKNITITPGAYAVFNPNHNDSNDTIWVGAVRTTFKF